MKTTKIYEMFMVVEGAGDFPIDMLRYDNCQPYRETDSHLIDRSYSHHEKRRVMLLRRSVNNGLGTADRWASFGWNLVMTTVDRGEALRDVGLVVQ